MTSDFMHTLIQNLNSLIVKIPAWHRSVPFRSPFPGNRRNGKIGLSVQNAYRKNGLKKMDKKF